MGTGRNSNTNGRGRLLIKCVFLFVHLFVCFTIRRYRQLRVVGKTPKVYTFLEIHIIWSSKGMVTIRESGGAAEELVFHSDQVEC